MSIFGLYKSYISDLSKRMLFWHFPQSNLMDSCFLHYCTNFISKDINDSNNITHPGTVAALEWVILSSLVIYFFMRISDSLRFGT